jgi:RNA polymerase sigma factor (TIGR02999 family)
MDELTGLLVAGGKGDRDALDRLLPAVYDELRSLAAAYLRAERPSHTLQPTALVHEAYMRLIDQRSVDWKNRAQFFGLAAQMMRRILVNHAEAKAAEKRGGGADRVTLNDAMNVSERQEVDVIAVDQALSRLAKLDERQAQIVELRFFAGLTVEEIAEILGVSSPTVKRDWSMAKAWLKRELAA